MNRMNTLLQGLQGSMEKALGAIREEAQRMDQAAASATGGKVEPIKMCTVPANVSYHIVAFAPSTMYGKPHWTTCAKAARDALEKARADVEAQHAVNLPLLENNKQVVAQVKLIMGNLGVPEVTTRTGFATARARKMTTTRTRAGYIDDLDAVCKTADLYDECMRKLGELEARIKRYETEEAEKERAADRVREQEKVARGQLTLLGALGLKYGCDPEYDDVVSVMANRDKYFGLAYWLYRNRNNWPDGPDRAQRGLDGFDVVTEEDRLVANDLQARIDTWSGDGRVFRDSPYGYDYLFAKADQDIMHDYGRLQEVGLVPED